jgi:preprotein translocase subunit SecA
MDYLKEGIGLRAMAQRDPLVEYQREGFDMFGGMLEGLKEESVGFLFNLQVEAAAPQAAQAPGVSVTAASAAATASASPAPAAPRPLPTQEAAQQAQGTAAPSALRAKGLDDGEPRGLTYSGPAEDGNAQLSRRGAAESDDAADAGTRRQRREAARSQSKGKKAPRTKRKR